MAQPAVYPLTFDPVFKDYPWGGRGLEMHFGRALPPGIIAESWEIAAHPNGSSKVNYGPLAGLTLPEVQARWGEALAGQRGTALAPGRFPLLVKLLDAHRWLSVQVHPDDAYALAHEADLGKTEMWVVLHAEPGAELIYGFQPGVDKAQFAADMATDAIERWLHRVKVAAGDVIFVPTGAIHALGPGIIVAEIQQNSDTTYRIYDWGRPRPVHLEKALDVLDFGLVAPGVLKPQPLTGYSGSAELIGECRYFRTERLTMPAGATYTGACDGATCEIWGVLAGRAQVEWREGSVPVAAVGWMLLPAQLGEFQVQATSASTLLRVIIP